jgi:hypothetical protein
VQRTATQRQYTTPVPKPGSRYEVEVWTVTSIGRGQSVTRLATTYQRTEELPISSTEMLKIRYCILSVFFYLICSAGSSHLPPSDATHYHIWIDHNMGTTFW